MKTIFGNLLEWLQESSIPFFWFSYGDKVTSPRTCESNPSTLGPEESEN
jgi:hypothetical protein